MRIGNLHRDDITQGDVGFVAGHHAGGDADVVVARDRQDVAAVGARLAGDGDAARLRKAHVDYRGEGAVEAVARIDQPERIGSEQAHAVGACGGDHPVLQQRAFRARLGIAGRKHQRGTGAERGQFLDHAHGLCRRDRDDGHLRRFRQRRHRRERFQPLHPLPPRVDWQNATAVALQKHAGDRPAADTQGVVGGANDGHRARRQKPREVGSGGGSGGRRGGAQCCGQCRAQCCDRCAAVGAWRHACASPVWAGSAHYQPGAGR